jgi:hypothetical protein
MTVDGLIYTMNYKDIEEKIEQYLSVREEEKNKHGEVFTPIELIEEMLDKLPNKVWSNPELKWLDPASGIGNFFMIIYSRLFKGLEKWQSNEKTRSNWIIANMLYMIEINPKNVKISKKIFGSRANICCADFLQDSEKCFNIFGTTNNFDIIIGNPPFQDDISSIKVTVAQGRHDIYPKFFIKSFELLNEDGYLSFINSAKWRAPDKAGDLKEMWDIFVKHNALFLKIYSAEETRKIFNGKALTRIDYYIIQKNTKYNNTIVIDEKKKEHKINLRDWHFLPNYDINNIKNILADEGNGIKIIYHSSQFDKRKPYVSETKKGDYKYPILHSHTIKEGNIFYWSNEKELSGKKCVKMFDIPKVILIKGVYTYPTNDYKGEYGMSNYSFGVPINSKKEGNSVVNAINSEGFKRLISATKWSSNFTDHNMFKYFRPDFYKYFLKKQFKKSTKRRHRSKKGNKTKKNK